MTPAKLNLSIFQASQNKVNLSTSKLDIYQVFGERTSVDEMGLYAAYYNQVPNQAMLSDINSVKANEWFCHHYQAHIKDVYYTMRKLRSRDAMEYDDIYYFLFDDVLLYLDSNRGKLRILFRNTSPQKVQELLIGFKKFKRRNYTKPQIDVLTTAFGSYETESLSIRPPKLSIADNYNDNFLPVHEVIYKRLRKQNEKGLVLLHGKPGTGKTSYIRYLLAKLRKPVVFLPPNVANHITNPDFMSFLIKNSNTIFVIEDAENIIVDRERKGYSPVSSLLNISDGLLSDCLNIQLICSFNTDVSKVDPALLRKGRLIAKYEFKELAANKAQALSDKLGFNRCINTPMTLADIYNQNDESYQEQVPKPIGFYA